MYEYAFGLLGELVKSCFAVMEPLVDEWMPLVQVELHKHQDVSLSNNVIWTLAEAVLKLGGCGYWAVVPSVGVSLGFTVRFARTVKPL